MQTSNALDPQSPLAREIYDLGIVSGVVFALIFAIVTGAIIYAIFRFRARPGEPDPRQIPGNRKVEIAWTIIPFLIVIFLLVMTLSAMNRADPPPPPSPDLVVTGHQFWWQVDYPRSGVITANEIHIPTGKPLSVRLESKDVLHEFWVPELTRKMTNVPGHLTTFGCKPTNRALTSASARSFAERNMPGCTSWSWLTNLRSSKNGNVLNYKQASRRQMILSQKDWRCLRHQRASTVMLSAE